MSTPLVSIIIPAYNSELYIADAIISAITQTYVNKEVIVIDNGSADKTLSIIRSFESEGIKIIHQKNNKGAAAARNTGLSIAKGTYVQFLDADDLLASNKIEAQVKALSGSITKLGLSRTVHFFDGEDHLNNQPVDDWFDMDFDNPIDFLIKLYAGPDVMPGYGGMVTVHSWLTPMALIAKAGPWNEKLSVDDDGEFFCRIILASEGIKYSEQGVSYYRKFRNGQSLSAQKNKKALESAVMAIDLKFEHLKASTSDLIIDRVFARHYWWTGALAYPRFKLLSKHCIAKAKALGYSGDKYVGGPSGHKIAGIFGWKTARLMAYYQQVFKRS